MSNIIKISIDTWVDQFNPIQNHLDDRATFEGTMFETFGLELDFVQAHNNNNVWTYITTDDDEDMIIEGFHTVNRIGYFITEYPRDDAMSYEITE